MTDDFLTLKTETDAALAAATDLRAWDAIRVAVLGKNGSLTSLLKELGKTPPEQRRERGAHIRPRPGDVGPRARKGRRNPMGGGGAPAVGP